VSTKLSLLRKKAIKRYFKVYKPTRFEGNKLFHLRKRLVIIHPCANEKELLRKIGSVPEACIVVDGYYFCKKLHQVCFFQIQSPGMWWTGVTSPQVLYSFAWHEYRSIKWKLHKFAVCTDCSPITYNVVEETIRYIDQWFDLYETDL